ncbi:MAG: VWA domain-containing protein [Candidatus Sericytochromatia bacterium]|nr:VWA domain-containing protein [Candidatus Sericytochromatia bacterium]
MSWASPVWLGVLLVVPLLGGLAWRTRGQAPGLRLGTWWLVRPAVTPRARWGPAALWLLRLAAIGCVGVGLARPLGGNTWLEEHAAGVDIMLALDLSGSMRAEDFQPVNRLVAAKQVIGEFIAKSEGNRLGLVAFAGRSLTVAPLTTDHQMVREALARLDFQTLREDGTAIGDAIGNCLYRLREENTQGRVVVLFTDGDNNSGYHDPIKAAGMAAVRGVRVHTIAVGRPGGAPIPISDFFGQKSYLRDSEGRLILTQINETSLKQIAGITGGRYFRATDTEALRAVYDEINRMEKTDFEVRRRLLLEERYQAWLLLAGGLLLAVLALGGGRWRVLEALR